MKADLTNRQIIEWIIFCCVLLLLLWLPGLGYPAWADTAYYALLGESFWTHGTYALNGVAHAKFLPLHAVYSYPFVAFFGYATGMKVATLVAGWAVIVAGYGLLKECFSRTIALAAILFLLIQPGFLLTTMLGASDALFTALLLGSAYFFVKAETHKPLYMWAGILLGLACLTRYNGVPVFGVYALWMLWKRRQDLTHLWSWIGLGSGVLILSTWFIRNAIVFGDPLHTDYVVVQDANSPSIVEQLVRSFMYYSNPLHSILPVFSLFALWGVIRFGRKQLFLILFTMGASALAAIWWAKGARYVVPVMPILLAFAVVGLRDVLERIPYKRTFVSVTALILLSTHMPIICAYDYGSCNAWIDKHIGILPKNLHLTPEGMYVWNKGKDYVNSNVPLNTTVTTDLDTAEVAVLEHTFRSDLHITERGNPTCAPYKLTQSGAIDGEVLFESTDQPTTRVLKMDCD